MFQITGKEQYGVQVYVHDGQGKGEAASELRTHLQFLESLKKHGFKEAHLLLARKAQVDEVEMALPQSFHIKWQELQPLSQDSNGPWVCAVLTV